MELFLQQLVNGLSLGGIYALIALGYTMVYGIIELINFAHGDVYTLGSFFSLAVLTAVGITSEMHGLPLVAAIIGIMAGSMVFCGVINLLLERFAYRPLRNAPRLAPLITAIGMSFVLENIMQLWQGPSPVPIPTFIPDPSFAIGNVTIQVKQVLVVGMAIVMMILLNMFVYRTKLGKAMRATAQDRDAAQLMGININMTIALTFLIAGALAGSAGFVSGVYYGTTWFFNGFNAGLKAFTAAVLGGIGNLAGAMLGGFVIGLVEAFGAQYVSDQWTNVMVFSLLVLVLIFRPSGLLGESLPTKV